MNATLQPPSSATSFIAATAHALRTGLEWARGPGPGVFLMGIDGNANFFSRADFLSVDSGSPIPEMEPTNEVAPPALRSNGLRGRVIGAATAKNGIFAITVNGDTIGVIGPVDLECSAPGWKIIARS